MGKWFLILIFGIPLSYAGPQIIHSGTEDIAIFEQGEHKIRGYWTRDKKGKALKYLSPAGVDYKVLRKGGKVILAKYTALIRQKGANPFPNPKTRMNIQTCSKVDLADKMGPVRDQTGGTCYAYSAMELLNFGNDKRYSALHLATLYEDKYPIDFSTKTGTGRLKGFNGGQIKGAMKLGLKNGLCPEEIMPSTTVLTADYSKIIEYYTVIRQNIDLMDKACKYDEKNPDPLAVLKATFDRGLHTYDFWNSDDLDKEISRVFPGIDKNRAKTLFLKSKSANDLIKAMAALACKGNLEKGIPAGKHAIKETRTQFIDHGLNYYYDEARDEIVDHINQAMKDQKPVAIAFMTEGLILPLNPASHGNHAGVIAGRSWLAEEKDTSGNVVTKAGCYYLVKNSWGPDWKVPDGLKARSSEQHPGYFVMSEAQIMEHVHGTTTLD